MRSRPKAGLAAAVLAAGALLTACGSSDEESDVLSVPLKNGDGATVAHAAIDFADGHATVDVTAEPGNLSPGFHGLHIHSVGKCEPMSTPPDGGDPADFLSAGGHFQAPGHDGHPMSGDLSSLQVRGDGTARLVTTTDAFTREDLFDDDGASIMIHAGPDNFGNIPDRYRQENGATGPDMDSLMTGDAGARMACGVLAAPK